MKNEYQYNLRLLQYADHLASIENHPEHGLVDELSFYDIDEGIRIHFQVRVHNWIFEELLVFDEFSYDEFGNPQLTGSDPDDSIAFAVCEFFDLDADQFCHLFDIDGYQDTARFGGEVLSEDSNCLIVANNIIDLVRYRRGLSTN